MPEVPIGDMLDDGRVQVRPLTTRGEVALYRKSPDGDTHCVVVTPDEAEAVSDWLHNAAQTARAALKVTASTVRKGHDDAG